MEPGKRGVFKFPITETTGSPVLDKLFRFDCTLRCAIYSAIAIFSQLFLVKQLEKCLSLHPGYEFYHKVDTFLALLSLFFICRHNQIPQVNHLLCNTAIGVSIHVIYSIYDLITLCNVNSLLFILICFWFIASGLRIGTNRI